MTAKRTRFSVERMPPKTVLGNLNATDYEPPVAITMAELPVLFGTQTLTVAGTTATATDAWHGLMIRFSQTCTVTLPAGLKADFSCGWSQEGAGAITFTNGVGATITSFGGLLSSGGQYAIGGIVSFAANTFRLYGTMA